MAITAGGNSQKEHKLDYLSSQVLTTESVEQWVHLKMRVPARKTFNKLDDNNSMTKEPLGNRHDFFFVSTIRKSFPTVFITWRG